MERTVDQHLGRGQRRLLVAAIYLGLVTYVVEALMAESTWWLSVVGFFGFFATIVIHFSLLLPFTQRIADEKESKLDERQAAVRNRAHRTAYQILGSVVMLALVYTSISLGYFSNQLWTPEITADNASTIAMGAVFFIITLPTAIIAWNEPDLEPEKESSTELERGAPR